jgi:hypothetical protein
MENLIPQIVILDLDGTLIGNTESIICYNEILNFVNQYMFTNERIHVDFENFVKSALSRELSRPFFKEFYNTLHEKYEHVEIFIYTASKTQWANFMINCFEETHDVKFNRPILTREDCVGNAKHYSKSIKYVEHKILDALKCKYYKENIKIALDNLFIVDDTKEIYNDNDITRLVKCPMYTNAVNVDVLELLPKDIVAKHYKHIAKILEMHMNMKFPQNTLNMYRMFSRQYKNNIINYKMTHTHYDEFWKKMTALIERCQNNNLISNELIRIWNAICI